MKRTVSSLVDLRPRNRNECDIKDERQQSDEQGQARYGDVSQAQTGIVGNTKASVGTLEDDWRKEDAQGKEDKDATCRRDR